MISALSSYLAPSVMLPCCYSNNNTYTIHEGRSWLVAGCSLVLLTLDLHASCAPWQIGQLLRRIITGSFLGQGEYVLCGVPATDISSSLQKTWYSHVVQTVTHVHHCHSQRSSKERRQERRQTVSHYIYCLSMCIYDHLLGRGDEEK